MDKFLFLILVFLHTITSKRLYTNKWIVQIKGEPKDAANIATKHGFVLNGEIYDNYYRFKKIGLPQKSTVSNELITHRLLKEDQVLTADQILWKRIYHRTDFTPNDRLWPDMWYVHKSTRPSMKIEEAWESGYTGRGVTIGIVDNGVDINHPDLKANIENGLSYDFMDNDRDPSPSSSSVRHGTLCAGTAAAVCNNTLCGCGIAYNAFIAGIKNNDGGTYSDIEAKSLVHKMNEIAIYSNSWGESDDTNFGGPDSIVQGALSRGVKLGRSLKGSIYVWASGNSGPDDNCNADGYVTSIYTIAIASVSRGGYSASYGETCSAILASTYSDIVTTDTNGGCNKKFTGTSASAPIASAIYSLALQANDQLTWRDIQHLTVETSSMTGLINIDVMENGVKRKVSHYFGFGLMNAEAMINAAKNWTLVSQQIECTESGPDNSLTIGVSREIVSNIATASCGNKIERLEHVEAHITFDCIRRGEVELFLTSAQGTQSKLLTKRRKDISSATSFSWKFMSVHYWGENPSGTWSLKMRVKDSAVAGSLTKWKLVFFGTKDNPIMNMNNNNSLNTDFTKIEYTTSSQQNDFAIIKNKTSKRKDNTTSYIAGGIAAVSIPSIGCAIYFAACRKKKKRQVSQAEKKPN